MSGVQQGRHSAHNTHPRAKGLTLFAGAVLVLCFACSTAAVQRVAALHDAMHDPTVVHKTCVCVAARAVHGWCGKCKVGHVAAVRVPSAELYEALDAHGHDVKHERLECKRCKANAAKGGYCSSCRMGFVDGLAYMSELTYTLANGSVKRPAKKSPAKTKCSTCQLLPITGGWCDRCRVGLAGNVFFKERKHYDNALRWRAHLEQSVKLLVRCELCAIAHFCDGACRIHRLKYTAGKSTPMLKPKKRK